MAKETFEQKKARLSKSSKYKQVLANLKEIREVKSLINDKLDVLASYINEAEKERAIQLKHKKALEVGDEITLEVKDVDAGGDEGDLGEEAPFGEEGEEDMGDEGPDEVVQMEKEFKLLGQRINAIKKQRARK